MTPRSFQNYGKKLSRRESRRRIEVILKGNFWWARPMLVGPRGLVMGPCIFDIDRIVIRDVQYQFEFQGSIANSVGGDSGHVELTDGQTIDRVVIRDVHVGEDSGQDGRTDGGDNHNITTLLKAWG
ncbi:hypothetical protein DPMN_156132 [Dreissena polymorpha]|uniref:Uncharacterized protein n=1 Tax=Dreissena polymorpha TaxID=45954 RepID=A0A9D4FTU4_DREPO|nr:hypothetical protein DPMN_156132 [Dreissena polymorpha]